MGKGYVFNIGFNKCGTTSLSAALNQLGIKTVHHHFPVQLKGRQRFVRLVDLWRSNLKNNKRPFAGLDETICGYSDFFGEACFKQLDRAYPGSKFILTVRPLGSWLASRSRHVEKNLEHPEYRGRLRTVDIDGWTRLYYYHQQQTRSYFAGRERDFLVMDIPSGHGWEKLCSFLSLPVPKIDFPWGNRSV